MERQQPRKRRRPARSCVACRRRKIKCDRNDPCAHCVSSKIQCVHQLYHEPVIQQRLPQHSSRNLITSPSNFATSPSSATRGRTNIPNLEHDSHPLRPTETSTALGQDIASHGSSHNPIQLPNQFQTEKPSVQDLLQRIQRLEQTTSAQNPLNGLSETGRDILERQAGLQSSQVVLNKTRILRWSHWMGTAPEVLLSAHFGGPYSTLIVRQVCTRSCMSCCSNR
jgi:hypothetical protein